MKSFGLPGRLSGRRACRPNRPYCHRGGARARRRSAGAEHTAQWPRGGVSRDGRSLREGVWRGCRTVAANAGAVRVGRSAAKRQEHQGRALCGEGSVIGIVRRRARNGTGSSSSTRASPSAKRSSSTPPLPGRRRVSRSCGSHPASCRLKSATFLTNAAICWEKLGSSNGPNATASRTPADVTISCQFASGKNLRKLARPTPFRPPPILPVWATTSVLLHPWRKFQQRVDQLPGEVDSSPP